MLQELRTFDDTALFIMQTTVYSPIIILCLHVHLLMISSVISIFYWIKRRINKTLLGNTTDKHSKIKDKWIS